MGKWTDWLDPNQGSIKGKRQNAPIPPGSDARSWLDKLAGVPIAHETYCGGCGNVDGSCVCDAKLGRPRRWWE